MKLIKILKNLSLILISLCIFNYTINYKDNKHAAIRKDWAQYVVKITNQAGNIGGTGFHVETLKGNTYILTNAHVCGLADKSETVWVEDEFGTRMPRKVLEASDFTDLCVIEAIPSSPGKRIKKVEINIPMHVYVLGHPQLQPLAQTDGEITSETVVEVFDHMGYENCDKPKNHKKEIPFIFGNIEACLIVVDSYVSTAQILPGNSGSPVYNDDGDIVAVAFAGGAGNRGFFVSLPEILKFLSSY